MTLSNGNSAPGPDGDRATGRAARRAARAAGSGATGPAGDRDIRHHPEYKTPWWRKPLKPSVFWIIIGVTVAVVIAAIIVSLSLGIALF